MASKRSAVVFITQGEMGDTSVLYKSDDSLPRQTHTHAQWPHWLVIQLNDVESDSPPETCLLFAYGKKLSTCATLVTVVV